MKKIVEIGYPASIEQSSGALSYSAMTAIVAIVGPTAVASFGISSRINSLVFLLAVGLGMGASRPPSARTSAPNGPSGPAASSSWPSGCSSRRTSS